MALELFKPFIMSRLVERKPVQNIKAAKKMVDSMIAEVWDVLEEVIAEHPVLLNRAPTLHRLGIQAFEPVLVEGKAIQIHPLVCTAFNADFDGDQMAVHLPLSVEAQAEARMLMLSANNILSPAHGAPIAMPTQDMVLGIYYLTYGPGRRNWRRCRRGVGPASGTTRRRQAPARVPLGAGGRAVVRARHGQAARPGRVPRAAASPVHILTTVGRIIFNERIERSLEEALEDQYDPAEYLFVNQPLRKRDSTPSSRAWSSARTARRRAGAGRLQGRWASSSRRAGRHHGVQERRRHPAVASRRSSSGYEGEVGDIMEQYDMGLISPGGAPRGVVEKWTAATDEVGEAMQEHLTSLNPIFMMANSGARGSFKQIRQLAGMRGLMANPKGEIIEHPIKANFMEGLSICIGETVTDRENPAASVVEELEPHPVGERCRSSGEVREIVGGRGRWRL